MKNGDGSKSQEYLIIGLGRFGSSVAATLKDAGHNVLAVDSDQEIVQHHANTLPHVVHMDATNREALEEIGAASFSTAIVCIGSDLENNLLSTVLLAQLGVPRVIAKATTRTQREILLKVGAHEVILPEHDAGMHLAQRLMSGQHTVDFLEINPEVSVVEVEAPKGMVGKPLAETGIRAKYGVTVIAIRRDDEVVTLPRAEDIISSGDILVVLGRKEGCERLSATM